VTHPPRRAAALAVVLVLLLSGCDVFGSDDSDSAGRPADPPSATSSGAAPATGLSGYYGQELRWSSCRGSLECATLRVPLDYARPGGRSIGVALLRVPAQSTSGRLGSMVVNPGGPGGSGVDYAAAAKSIYGAPILKAYDVVGFDPRGVGRSAPVECASDKQFNTLLQSDPDPDTAEERAYSDRLLRAFGRGCLTRSGGIARHMSTVEVARDLDVLRAALGDSRLTYFGASYGTAIGATYADLFPTRVGRMVLDGALDPTSSTLELNLVQARGFETALRAYVGACVQKTSCFLGATVDAGTRRIRRFLDSVERTPLPTASGRPLTIGNAVYGINFPLYDEKGWSILDQGLEKAFDGDGSLLMTLADGYLDRNTDGSFDGNSFQAFYAVNCLDHDDAVPTKDLQRYRARFEKASPTFGRAFLYSATACAQWPIHTGKGPVDIDAKGMPPVLVIGTTRDPATPLVWAKALARQLPDSVLITRDGDGHTGYGQGSACVDDAVEAYLASGTVPRSNLTCS
jgi:pimeloyl-ACP methyl ester carboxylesterase